ncbi:MAG: F0F1 ATP synthase subunit A [Bacteroidota bacterium]
MALYKYLHNKLRSTFYPGLLFIFLAAPSPTWGTATKQDDNFVMHHISDAHEWHLATLGDTHITLPLPVIIFSKDRGLVIFSSSRFFGEHHCRIPYQGYQLDEHDKIIALDAAHTFYDLSITKNVAAILISVLILLVMLLKASQQYRYNSYLVPRGFWALLELIIVFVKEEIAIPNIGKQQYERFMPYLLTVFFFIALNNLLGLLPGAANVTGNISVTLVLAAFTFVLTTINGNKLYWQHIFSTPGVPKWLAPIMLPVELIGLFIRPISLAFRLFANITAGHIILLSIISLIFIFETELAGLVSVPLGTLIFLLKLIVALLQAYIFTLLSAIYFGTAVGSGEE